MVEHYYSGYGYNIKTIEHSNIPLSSINPYRYRGYYQDNETGWYYLNSRYYDSDTCRFISMDDISYLGSSNTINYYNLFTYCENNPVMFDDTSGHFIKTAITFNSFYFRVQSIFIPKKKKYTILDWEGFDSNEYNSNLEKEQSDQSSVRSTGSVTDGMINKNVTGVNDEPIQPDMEQADRFSEAFCEFYNGAGVYEECFEYFAYMKYFIG